MEIKEKFRNLVRWYIKGYYHCDQCPYSWEERGVEGDADAGCYIKGDICDTCRLIQPFKGIIGRMRKNRYEYWKSKRYEGYGEWYEEEEKRQDVFNAILLEFLEDYQSYIFCENNGCKDRNDIAQEVGCELRRKYEDAAHPVVIKTLKVRWKELIGETSRAIADRFKQYF